MGDLHIEAGGKQYVIREVEALKAMGALIKKEAMKFRMNKADKALWVDMKFYKNKGIVGGRKQQKVQRGGSIVHSSLMRRLELERRNGRCFT